MVLKVNEMVKKAEEKGYKPKVSAGNTNYTKPWQNESVLTINDTAADQNQPQGVLLEVDPNLIENWEYHDRPEAELGNIEEFADDLIKIGQQQPCIIRKHKLKENKYELIIGERRWRAAKHAGIKLKVIISDLDDNTAALAQAAENDQRQDLSDYAKGISFSKLIENNIIKQKDLVDRLSKSKQYVSALLSFSKLPENLIKSIGDMSKVSARTAEKMKQLCMKGDEHIDAIIIHSEKIREGKIGNQKLEGLVNKTISHQKRPKKEPSEFIPVKKIYDTTGRHLFTWRLDNNRTPSIHFPKDILKLFKSGKLNNEDLTAAFSKIMEDRLMNN